MSVGSVEWIGTEQLHKRLAGMQERYLAPEQDYAAQIELLEANERDVFAALHGRYVNTGATKRSLTEGGGDAVREIIGSELEFGTRVWYARFLTRAITASNRRTGGSAVLRLSRVRANLMSRQLLSFLVNGTREVLAALNQELE
jgi:hypothetical protein